jgi:hypothetical protein
MLFDLQYLANDHAIQAAALWLDSLDFEPCHREAMCEPLRVQRGINPFA